ncbi:MAG TPA: hypothetical protein PLQ39_03690 [Acinetobacter sp.]|jgi:hypothetical protein|nr:hypothetical protein [Acinetobacter sp.]HQZ58786.1 hypothetical protein [Acinetobacter sp.]
MKKFILVAFMALPMLAQAQTFKYQKDDYGFKHYKGQATLTGTYSRILDPQYLEYMGDTICFEPNKASSRLIPRQKGDTSEVRFCFSNFDKAEKVFQLPNTIKKNYCQYEGQATIYIKDYKLFTEETEGFNATQLIAAKNISPAKAVKCKFQN